MVTLYSFTIRLYRIGIALAALFSPKAQQWVRGRVHLFESLETAIRSRERWIWVHVSSLGEFEQGRPVIENLSEHYPQCGIVLSFFSPSGYEVRKDYRRADHVTYIPLDTRTNARRWVQTVRPVLTIFVKYDLWYHHLRALEETGSPVILISAAFRPAQWYFRPWGRFMEDRLRSLRQIFTQTHESEALLKNRGFNNVRHSGDTRIDRVLEIATQPRDFSWLKDCLGDDPVLVAGSTWPADEKRLLPATAMPGLQLIIAPHEISENRISALQMTLPEAVLLSELRAQPRKTRMVIVDSIGDLAHLYALGAIAWVGGGFGSGIHNILEPVAHGIPVIFGPRYRKFHEAHAIIAAGAASPVTSSSDAREAIIRYLDQKNREEVKKRLSKFFEMHRGATAHIMDFIGDSVIQGA